MNSSADLISYRDRLNGILTELLPDPISHNSHPKVIHDPLWGSRLFYPWEIALLDTPLCQRLRRIYQLGTAFLTYPSAVHTRFSHSLGVAILAGRLIARLREKAEVSRKGVEITNKDLYTVRIAGLLHDIGHCFFSHASEKVLGPITTPIRKELGLGSSKPHEFFAYLILTHDYFKEYWGKWVRPLFHDIKDSPDPDDMAKIIVGIRPSNEKRFLQEIISGPYDVDKLEYLYRDAKMAGLQISYDIERFFYKISLAQQSDGTWRLVMDQGGVRAVEQLIFSKMMLFSFVYHHQKVLASDAMVSDLIMELLNNPPENDYKIEHPLDFLRYTDSDFLASYSKGPSARFDSIKTKLLYRYLPKRCFVIGTDFVNHLRNDKSIKDNWDKLKEQLRALPPDVEIFRKGVVEILKSLSGDENISSDDFYAVFPSLPSIDEASHAPVLNVNEEIESISDYFDLEGWQKTYDLKKLRGYFYVSEKFKDLAAQAVEQYIQKQYGLTFKNNARIEAKLNSISIDSDNLLADRPKIFN